VKILWVKSNKLLPVHSGGDIRSYNIARQLARDHQLTFLSYYDGKRDEEYERELGSHFSEAVCVATGKSDSSSLVRGVDYLAHLAALPPYAVGRFGCAEVRNRLERYYRRHDFDVAICDFLDAAINFPRELSIPTILFQHNVESEIWRRHATTETNPLKRQMYAVEFRKMLRYERNAVRKFQHVIAVSQHDRSLMEVWVEGARITVVPTGVDLEQYRPEFRREAAPTLNVVFVGAMDWEPNVDAMQYFCDQIWPGVLSELPGAKLRIVGRNPGSRTLALASSSIEVTGRVPSVAEYLRDAAVVVVPLRIGGGTRLKIYEAMAAGRAVVSTSIGAEGLDVHHGRDIVLADSPRRFTEAVITLLRDDNLRRKYELAARDLAAQFDWSVIGRKFAKVLEMVHTQSVDAAERMPAGVERE